MTMLRYKLGFIGAGNMAEAIARAAMEREVVSAGEIIAFDPSAARREVFGGLGIAIAENNEAVVAQAQQIVLAIKPQMLPSVGGQLAGIDVEGQVIVSIMAGIAGAKIAQAAGKPLRIVRVMPNTPMLVGAGMAGVALGEHAKPGDDDLAMRLFGAGGKAIRVPEAALDAITAISGSGPAYLFYLAEAMQRAAAELGLAEHATLLVRQTLLGAAMLLDQSSDTAAELRHKVTSPGGTTEAAIDTMESRGVADAIIAAIRAAEARSRELGA